MEKKFVLLLLSASLLCFNAYGLSDCTEAEIAAGNCWDCGKTDADLCTARKTGSELKITGTGEMRDYVHESGGGPHGWGHTNTPWGYDYTNISVEGVKSIGKYAFQYTLAGSATISDSVVKIEDYAFSAPVNLISVNIPDSVTSIGNESFGAMAWNKGGSVSSLFIPDSVSYFDPKAFYWARIGTIYCAETTNCDLIESPNVKTYTTDTDGVYKVDGSYYASPDDMTAQLSCGANDSGDGPSDLCKTKAAEYKLQKAESMAGGALCKSKGGCLQLLNMAQDKIYCTTIAACKAYGNEHGITFGDYTIKNKDGSETIIDQDGNIIAFKGKRIYTVEEASAVTKPLGNTFRIRYR